MPVVLVPRKRTEREREIERGREIERERERERERLGEIASSRRSHAGGSSVVSNPGKIVLEKGSPGKWSPKKMVPGKIVPGKLVPGKMVPENSETKKFWVERRTSWCVWNVGI